jgi:hypothetical protein
VAEKKFLDFMDRFDGGGARATGDKFEGGGLLSMLGNIFATPRGSEDRAKQEALAGLLGQTRPPMGQTSAAPQPQSQSPLEMFGGQQPAPYSSPAQGSGMTPANNYAPSGTGPELPAQGSGAGNDPFAYNGDRLAGMRESSRYDFVDGLPDDALDFTPIPNPFAGSAGVGGYSQSLDSEILRNAPTGLPSVQPQGEAPEAPLSFEGFARHLMSNYDQDSVRMLLSSPEKYKPAYDLYVRNGGKL